MSNPVKCDKSIMTDPEIIQVLKASLNGADIEKKSILGGDAASWEPMSHADGWDFQAEIYRVRPTLVRPKRYKPKVSSEVDAITFGDFVVFGRRVTIHQLDEYGKPRSFFFFGHSVELEDTLSYIIDQGKGTSLQFTAFDMLIVRADNSLTVLPRDDFFRSYTEIEG